MGGIDPDSRRAFPWDGARWDRELLASVQAALRAAPRRAGAPVATSVAITGASGDALAFQRGDGERRWRSR